jgi:hypothetical protein
VVVRCTWSPLAGLPQHLRGCVGCVRHQRSASVGVGEFAHRRPNALLGAERHREPFLPISQLSGTHEGWAGTSAPKARVEPGPGWVLVLQAGYGHLVDLVEVAGPPRRCQRVAGCDAQLDTLDVAQVLRGRASDS